MSKRFIQNAAILLVSIGAFVSVWLIVTVGLSGYRPWGDIDFPATGEFGDFIGGVVGTIISAAGFIFLFLTLKEQREAFSKERFENDFFELLKLQRDNANELKLKKWDGDNFETYEGREVFNIIFQEFLECLQEVRRFSNSRTSTDYIKPQYLRKLQEIIQRVNPLIDVIELATIDIAYSIVFFGADKEGEIVLRHRFIKRYNDEYFYRILRYIQLKPKKEFIQGFENWKSFQSRNITIRTNTVEEIYSHRNHLPPLVFQNVDTENLLHNLNSARYYSGHQYRLGHYFRHLFQSYKFLNEQDFFKKKEKYFYGKTLRAQLSTYEQALLFINSISSLGMKWELSPELNRTADKKDIESVKLITYYNLIKNLPGEHLFGIRYKSFYPNVKYENDEL